MIGVLQVDRFEEGGVVYPFKTHIEWADGPTKVVDAHYHQHIEILYCLSGQYRLFLNGTASFFSTGDMVVINAMETHAIVFTSEGRNEYLVIRFEPELLFTKAQTLYEAKYVLPFTMSQSNHQRVFRATEIENTVIPELLREVIREDAEKTYACELAIRTYLGQIILWILRYWYANGLDLNVSNAVNQSTKLRLQPAFDFVEAYYAEEISASKAASHCNMSYSYFCRTFKQVMGHCFTNYVNFIRVSKAEHQLMTSDFSITEIALSVGFSTSSYFIEQFKTFKGVTPLQFRQAFLAKHLSHCRETDSIIR